MRKYLFVFVFALIALRMNAQILYFPFSGNPLHTGYIVNDSINFEGSFYQLQFDNDYLWQVGVPQKTIFSQAWSLPNALITDTLNPYPDSSNTYFYFKLLPYELGDFFIAFNHKVDVGLGDSCIVEFSMDGAFWQSLLDFQNETFDGEVPTITYFDTDLNNGTTDIPIIHDRNLFYTDTTLNWTQTAIWLDWVIYVKDEAEYSKFTDSLFVRFRFVSGQNTQNQEGWLIDNIYMGSFTYKVPGNIHESDKQKYIQLFPNPTNENIFWFSDEFVYPLKVSVIDMNGKIVYYESVDRNFLNLYFISSGMYLVEIQDYTGKKAYSKLQIQK